MEDLQIKIMWAINTIRDQIQFGLDPLLAAKSRERRAKGVLLDCYKKLESFQSENSELKSKVQELEEQIEKMKVEIERRKHCYDCADDCDHCPLRNYLKPVIGN